MTGEEVVNAEFGFWDGFNAAHVFPLAYEDHWIKHNYGQWITKPPATGGDLNSVQTGLLLRTDIHQLFDSYIISINPDVCMGSDFVIIPSRASRLMILSGLGQG